jgi:hypothetical protein
MTFVYDPVRRLAFKPGSNAVLKLKSCAIDEVDVLLYSYEDRDLVVDFFVRSCDVDRVHIKTSIIEESLRRAFERAKSWHDDFERRAGTYATFRETIRQAVAVHDTGGGEHLKRVPDFAVEFVENY